MVGEVDRPLAPGPRQC